MIVEDENLINKVSDLHLKEEEELINNIQIIDGDQVLEEHLDK